MKSLDDDKSCDNYRNRNGLEAHLLGRNEADCHEKIKKTQTAFIQFCTPINVVIRLIVKTFTTIIDTIFKEIHKTFKGEDLIFRSIMWCLIIAAMAYYVIPNVITNLNRPLKARLRQRIRPDLTQEQLRKEYEKILKLS